MTQIRKLRNPPITEALVDLRVKPAEGLDVQIFERLHERLRSKYPQKRTSKLWESSFEMPGEGEPRSKVEAKGIDGYLFVSKDDQEIVQFKKMGFTFNRLRPYESWESVRDKARPLWDLYREAANPDLVTRIAVRYINNLDLPLPIPDLREFITAPPEVPAGLPQKLESYLSRVVIRNEDIGATAIITQKLDPGSWDKTAPILLDIDVSRLLDDRLDEEDLWGILGQLREFKNQIFFSSLTEEAIRSYE